MGKVTDLGLAGPDDPIYKEPWRVFSPGLPPSTKTSSDTAASSLSGVQGAPKRELPESISRDRGMAVDQIGPHPNALVSVLIGGTLVTRIDLVNQPYPGQAQNYVLKCCTSQQERDVTEEWEAPIPTSVVDCLFQEVAKARLPVRTESMLGLDGVSYEVAFGYPHGSRFSWWLDVPAGWEVLAEVVGTLRSHSGRYL